MDDLSQLSAPSNVAGVPALHAHLGILAVTNTNISAKEREIKVRSPANSPLMEYCINGI